MRFHMLQNVQMVLDYLRFKKVKLVNIRAEDIVDGNPKLTLGLIWTIILHYQVSSSLAYSLHAAERDNAQGEQQRTRSSAGLTVSTRGIRNDVAGGGKGTHGSPFESDTSLKTNGNRADVCV